MAKNSPEGRHDPKLFEFSPQAEADIAAKIRLLQQPQITDDELASVRETQDLSVEELLARVIGQKGSR